LDMESPLHIKLQDGWVTQIVDVTADV
jgi:hypothetical protein